MTCTGSAELATQISSLATACINEWWVLFVSLIAHKAPLSITTLMESLKEVEETILTRWPGFKLPHLVTDAGWLVVVSS